LIARRQVTGRSHIKLRKVQKRRDLIARQTIERDEMTQASLCIALDGGSFAHWRSPAG
jgi:hypothetical protein